MNNKQNGHDPKGSGCSSPIFLLLFILRLTASFLLACREKRTWIPLALNAPLWLLMTLNSKHVYLQELGDYTFHITGLQNNDFVATGIAFGCWLWIVIGPYICYAVLLARHKLKDNGINCKVMVLSLSFLMVGYAFSHVYKSTCWLIRSISQTTPYLITRSMSEWL